ncbi:hypothetical protein [Microvirga solisilvae]|uniref:hypothetical protein n=1 Tax=Microvirga solisilvae TaxID=2919498 RepID=UPI001FB02472|nr:hypothetical protein [Microvirga solisilvae]
MKRVVVLASLSLTFSIGIAKGADLKDEKALSVGLIISPIGPAGWQDEQYRYTAAMYGPVTHSKIKAVCWPDMRVCQSSAYVLCDLEDPAVAETLKGSQVETLKLDQAPQCILQENLSRLEKGEDFLRGSITYRKGARP